MAERSRILMVSIGDHSKPNAHTAAVYSAVTRLSRWERLVGTINVEGTIVLLGLFVAWQIASFYLPPILFPSLQKILFALSDLLRSPPALAAIGTTYLRILVALIVAFTTATALGVIAGLVRPFERAIVPLVEVMQGVPAVCWIIFAILWFRDMETRIAFVVIVTALPSFFYQARDGLRSIQADLWDMVRSWRPSTYQLVRILILPALLPALLTGWRVNLGNGTRVTIMAELLAGVSGIGYQLRLSEELFRMDRAIAWTVVLVAFVVATNCALSSLERVLLRWRNDRSVAHD
jgi:ABC-type nitrate/sulfonate/bicarbonate transport system permease component